MGNILQALHTEANQHDYNIIKAPADPAVYLLEMEKRWSLIFASYMKTEPK